MYTEEDYKENKVREAGTLTRQLEELEKFGHELDHMLHKLHEVISHIDGPMEEKTSPNAPEPIRGDSIIDRMNGVMDEQKRRIERVNELVTRLIKSI